MRDCGDCKACCWAPEIEDLKQPGEWCRNCDPTSSLGCKVYDSRPDACRSFYCAWAAQPKLVPEELYPRRSRVMITAPESGIVMVWELIPGAAERPAVVRWMRAVKAGGNRVLIANPRTRDAKELV